MKPFELQELLAPFWIPQFEDKIEAPPENLQILLKDAIDTGPNLANSMLIVCAIMAKVQAYLFIAYLRWSFHQSEILDD